MVRTAIQPQGFDTSEGRRALHGLGDTGSSFLNLHRIQSYSQVSDPLGCSLCQP